MINRDTIIKLANLSRIEISEDEIVKIEKDLGAILEYVSELKSAPERENVAEGTHINILREDAEPHIAGLYTDDILNLAPKTKDGYVVVKQVMGGKK